MGTRMEPSDFAFVVATHPAHFKNKENERIIRSKVMHDYLHRASKDSGSTDRRITRRRPFVDRRFVKNPRIKGLTSSIAITPDSPTEEDVCSEMELSKVAKGPTGLPEDHMTVFDPIITPSIAQTDLATIATSMQRLAIADDITACASHVRPLIAKMHYTGLAGKMPFLMTLPLAFFGDCESNGVNLVFLKIICMLMRGPNSAKLLKDTLAFAQTPQLERKLTCDSAAAYFGCHGCSEKWIPLVIHSHEAFLSCLCIIAPFADLSVMGSKQSTKIRAPEWRQTLAIMSVVPRVISNRISNAPGICDDQIIVSIAQLLYSQLASPSDQCIESHQRALDQLVRTRGGLPALGGNGVIAEVLVITEFEVAILKNKTTNKRCRDWMLVHHSEMDDAKPTILEGPLYSHSPNMLHLAKDKFCTPETLALVQLMYRLTNVVVKLSENTISDDDEENHAEICAIAWEVHQYKLHQLTLDASPLDSIYETTRRVALCYAHAIYGRHCLHERQCCNWHLPDGQVCDSISPHMIYRAVRSSPIDVVWNRLAGVLYWILMIGSASALHPSAPPDDLYGIPTPRQDSKASSPVDTTRKGRRASNHRSSVSTSSREDSYSRSAVQHVQECTTSSCESRSSVRSRSMFSAQQQADTTIRVSSQEIVGYAQQDCPEVRHSQGFSTETSHGMRTPGVRESNKGSNASATAMSSKEVAAQDAYAGQCLTTHLLRVSVLLRFEHPDVVLESLYRLEKVTSWLRGG